MKKLQHCRHPDKMEQNFNSANRDHVITTLEADYIRKYIPFFLDKKNVQPIVSLTVAEECHRVFKSKPR